MGGSRSPNSISPVKLALKCPILLVAFAVNSVSEFFLNSSHPGIACFRISGLFNASQTFCFSKLISKDESESKENVEENEKSYKKPILENKRPSQKIFIYSAAIASVAILFFLIF